MELRSYLTAIRRGWWIIVGCAVLGAALGAFLAFRATPIYAAHVQFWVKTYTADSPSNAYSSEQFAQARAVSYAELLSSSSKLADMVKDASGVDLTAAQISSEMSGSAQLNTLFVNATVEDSSPSRALKIAEGVATELPKLADTLTNSDPKNPQATLIVTSDPSVGSAPVSPRKTLDIGLGLLAGLVIGLVAAIVRYVMDATVRTSQELERLVDAPVLATIGLDGAAEKSPLVIGDQEHSLRAEALRRLRTNLQFLGAAGTLRSVVVTSSVESEGKTLTSVNLAIVAAANGGRVLLIEGDLRRPRVADYLELERGVGLSNVLIGRATFADVVQDWGPHGLQVLTGGVTPPNPSELLGSPAMAQLLAQFHQDYDLVIIDTPPLGPVTDAAVLGAQADGVLVVFRYGKTKRAQLARTMHALDVVGARKLGAVMNMKPIKRSERAYYGRYQEHDATAAGTAFPEPTDSSGAGRRRTADADSPAHETAKH